jgi:vancomycin resistance protein VanW
MRTKTFSELNPLFYRLSVLKGIFLRNLTNRRVGGFARSRQLAPLPHLVTSYQSPEIRELAGIAMHIQQGRKHNMFKAAEAINGIIIRPGEIFSFWDAVGKCSAFRGYQKGFIVGKNGLTEGYGGGVCLVASHVHNLVLGSPLRVVELHHHSDALFPDVGPRIPYGIGVSVFYNYIDYRFINNSQGDIQLLIRPSRTSLYGEMRAVKQFSRRYELCEMDHHFVREGDDYYRKSVIYRNVFERETGEILPVEFLHNLHSKVMYDPALIPQELIR